MKALSACHPDITSRLANVLGWRRMDWSRMEGRGVLQAQGLPSDTARKGVLCGPNLRLPMEERGWKKPRGHPPTESQRRKRTMTPRPSVALPRGRLVWNPAPCIQTPLLQATTPAFTFPLFFPNLSPWSQILPYPHESPPASALCRAILCPHVTQLLSYLCLAYHTISREGQRLRVY